ncbi:HlyD family efflux transporter periplasmic adaptor subunit [Anthocerotibacter panamensis]|uniref:HlyD family efflux transporter periplasmic adaptor subunit n=1 Tax=Anthocerotibacter panamensis TaxID=2857077 RepID=UPI001C402E45|nr:HlyD family efflux transporter periplasmic adaptor subunit [Anthocerotibacter panamensis]
MQRKEFWNNKVWLLVAVGSGAALMVGTLAFLKQYTPSESNVTPRPARTAVLTAVSASGRLEPDGGVMTLAAPSSVEFQRRVVRLSVKEGDQVRAGQLIAILDPYARRLASLTAAEQEVRVAQSRLAQIRAGAKPGDIAAQNAAVARLKTEFANAETEFRRFETLARAGAVSASNFDAKRLERDATRQQLQQAQATLTSVREVRLVDVRAAQEEVAAALSQVLVAQADLELTYVRAPIDGQILKVQTNPGEVVDQGGIVKLGQTKRMFTVAEVYESDIAKIRLGQRATITSAAIPGVMHGTVTKVGLEIAKKDILSTDPVLDVDARVVEVKIRLDPADSRRVSALTNMKVEVNIEL